MKSLRRMMLAVVAVAAPLAVCSAGDGLTVNDLHTNLTGNVLQNRLKGNPLALAAPKSAKPALPVFGKDGFRDSRRLAPMKASATEPQAVIGPATVWGVINGPGDTDWMYEQENTTEDYKITSSKITVYDDKGVAVGTISIDIPDNEYVNDVQPFGQITTNFFERNATTYELTVFIHDVSEEGAGQRIEVYTLGGDADPVATFAGSSTAMYMGVTRNYSTFQRYFIVDIDETGDSAVINVDVYSPATYSSGEAVLEHTFQLPYDNVMYSDGPFFNYYYIDGQPYYVVSQYEKPYMSGYDTSTWEPILTEDNNYLITVYDANYAETARLTIPVERQTGAYYTFYTFGYFSYDDLCKGLYTGDDQLNFIVTRYDYMLSGDNYLYDIIVYDETGNQVATIGEDLTTWMQLSPIDGQPTQYAFIHIDSDSESIQMVDLPSCETVVTFPGYLNGELLSTNLDRCPVGDSYQYVIAHGNGYDDGLGNTITRIGWYNKDLTLDRTVDINLGPNGTYARHYFVTGSLNPYLFNTDDLHEYIIIASITQDDGTTDNVLCIANDNGDIIASYAGDETLGAYTYGYISGAETATPRLIVGYMNDNWQYTLETYDLPFSRFTAGGDGTSASPYLITTAGDLNQVRNAPAAHYALAADIDMSSFYGKFSPIPSFSGSLDGRGHTISNLNIEAESMYSGLFGSITECDTIKNITFNNPVIEAEASCFYAGVVAGSLSGEKSAIVNTHVNNALITGDATFTGEVGGLVGSLTYYATLASSSAVDITVDAPSASNVGGLVGSTRTGSKVIASKASGTLTASDNIGGVLGNAGNDVQVSDCYADIDITGQNSIGGIAGYSSRALVNRCYAVGKLTATEADRWTGNHAVGGIIGDLATDWSASTTIVVSNCLAAVSSITLPDGDEPKAVHRIIGRSIDDETWYDDEDPLPERGLSNNYALADMTIGGQTITANAATTTEGADVAAADITDRFFANTLGFVFGSSAEEPWKAGGGTGDLPRLYFEADATGISAAVTDAHRSEPSISIDANAITAVNATRIDAYTTNGIRMATTDGSTLNTAALPCGIYIVVATDDCGNRQSYKVRIKN